MSDHDTATVSNNPEQSRYEAHVGDALAGFAHYNLGAGTIEFDHTEVDPAFEGEGIGTVLVGGALDAVRADGGRSVIATCPFVKRWIARHPDYADLLA